ncbi:bifunctional diguanylate cyclase/phosphodiesterase [Cellvibrio sp. PSBB006]|jgi:diguanylate cyclase (GGDEF)-like protein/PAS domain S-box-containing protein|uniref:putative bifunctional diguanylate cyclase/phosphodiesterase n=1 Tax=Cellvibrio sp. PSBB006 TaxID=1987723 RepID=UPI000B3B65D4|nr:GGDEF domain-containing response regulator [Cellvibrio sp. PSBB006]ARU27113.1 two-component system response regulator [Cellvibrio sp. PSBB006]
MGKSLNVLFIEDSEADAELTTAELARGGFIPHTERVETRHSMLDALTKAEWDVILCDYSMPRFSAEAALQTLKESGQDIPFIITSGAVDAEDTVSLLKQGAHDFMNKEALARLVPAIEREIREAEVRRQRRLAEERVRILSSAVQQSPVSVLITNPDGQIEYVNPKYEQITGYASNEAIGRDLGFTLLNQTSADAMAAMRHSISNAQEWRGEFCSIRRDGQVFWEFVSLSPLRNETGDLTHFVIIKEDITVRRSYEERLLRQAHYDDLTGLANRVLMLEHLNVALESSARNHRQTAMMCIDLDRFKNVNDSLGHSCGDDVLRESAGRLSGCIRNGDILARMGGDEFIIILPDISTPKEAEKVAEKIIAAFAQPFFIGGKEYFVTASIGIALSPKDGRSANLIQRNADLAMYKAKELGRNRYHFFTEDINTQLMQRLELEVRLRQAIALEELELHYQPIYDINTNMMIGFEALVRWRQPDGSLLMPVNFIPMAEDIGIIQEIDKWVMATACADAAKLVHESKRALRLSLNVSPKQLQIPDYANFVAHQLFINNLSPTQLELEVTERVIMQNDPQTQINITALCDLGVRLSIDDFGTGYSSLAYLQKFPFKTLKIDRGFVSQICEDPNTHRLVDTIITMAHGLDMEIVAEGIENDQQRQLLQKQGCDHAQGYFFSYPGPLKDLREKINTPWEAPSENPLH